MRQFINSAGGRRFLLVLCFAIIAAFSNKLGISIEVLQLILGGVLGAVTGITVTDATNLISQKK